MTLTSIIPSLRASMPDPLAATAWPGHTSARLDDVVVAGVSMTGLAAIAGTPCVHTDESAPPLVRPRGWIADPVTVIVASVVAVRRPSGRLLLELDACLPAAARLDEMRLIGRTSTAPLAEVFVVTPCDAHGPAIPFRRLPVPVPVDVRLGDLVCVPCSGTLTHRDVTGRTLGGRAR
jgi:hypothetical protein